MVKVYFYAAARAAFGVGEANYDANSLSSLINELSATNTALAKILPACTFLVNSQSCSELEIRLNDGDQVDILPQFSGG